MLCLLSGMYDWLVDGVTDDSVVGGGGGDSWAF